MFLKQAFKQSSFFFFQTYLLPHFQKYLVTSIPRAFRELHRNQGCYWAFPTASCMVLSLTICFQFPKFCWYCLLPQLLCFSFNVYKYLLKITHECDKQTPLKKRRVVKMVKVKVTIRLFFLIFNHSKREFTKKKKIAQNRSQISM